MCSIRTNCKMTCQGQAGFRELQSFVQSFSGQKAGEFSPYLKFFPLSKGKYSCEAGA